MPQIIAGVSGARKQVKKVPIGVSGVTRDCKEAWAGVGGVNKKVFARTTIIPVDVSATGTYVRMISNRIYLESTYSGYSTFASISFEPIFSFAVGTISGNIHIPDCKFSNDGGIDFVVGRNIGGRAFGNIKAGVTNANIVWTQLSTQSATDIWIWLHEGYGGTSGVYFGSGDLVIYPQQYPDGLRLEWDDQGSAYNVSFSARLVSI